MSNSIKLQNEKGFTLVELLLVVIIIAILTGVLLSIVNVGGIRSKARDSQRIADLKRIQGALELYYSANRTYPVGDWTALAALDPNYINILPNDPQSGWNYYYNGTSTDYVLTAQMEVSTSAQQSPCSSLNNSAMDGSGFSPCYGVENP